jgi:hypothetical protein
MLPRAMELITKNNNKPQTMKAYWTKQRKAAYLKKAEYLTTRELAALYGLNEESAGIYKRRFKTGYKAPKTSNSGGVAYLNGRRKHQRRKDANPVGTIVYHKKEATGDSLAHVITETGRIRLHIHNWLKAGKTIPEGYILCYKDPTRWNRDAVDNLELRTRLQNILMHRKAVEQKVVFKTDLPKKPRVRERGPYKPRPAKPKPIMIAAKASPKKAERKYATRPLNLSQKIKVQLDRRTWVYVTPGSDIEAIRQKYLKKAS